MGSTPMEMAISYANMCKYYELCIPGLETKNPHFKSSLHLFKKEQSPVVIDNTNNLPVASSLTLQNTTPVVTNSPFANNQDNQSIPTTGGGGGGRNLKLLFKGKKDNKIHVKCSCNDITDGSAIKRKFLIKCNKCQAMVHGKCHNLNAQLFNNGNNHPTTWFCSMCTVDIQNDARKTAMVEDIKRAIHSSPSSSASSQPLTKTAGTTTNTSKVKQNKKEATNNNKEKNSNANRSTSTKTKHKEGPKKNENNNEKREKNEEKNKERKGKNTKDSKKNLKRSSSLISNSNSNSQSKSTCKKTRYVPIQPKQTYSNVV